MVAFNVSAKHVASLSGGMLEAIVKPRQPPFGCLAVGEVGYTFTAWRIGLELAVAHVLGDGTAFAVVLGQPSVLARCQHIVLDAPCSTCTVSSQEALAYLGIQLLVTQATHGCMTSLTKHRFTRSLRHRNSWLGHQFDRFNLEFSAELLSRCHKPLPVSSSALTRCP